MSRIELVKSAVNKQLNDSYDLLAVRLLFPPEHVVVNIQKEIKDLYVYPERLESGYCDEWRAIATRALFRNAFGEHWRSDEENLQLYLKHCAARLTLEESAAPFYPYWLKYGQQKGFVMGQQLTCTTKSVVLFLIISLGFALVWASQSFANDNDEEAGIQDTIQIQDSILRQIEAFANNDGEQAWAYASEGIKRRFGSSQVFVEMVREAYPAVHSATQIEFTESVPHGIFHIQVVKLKGPEGKSWDAYYRMVQVEDVWKIAGVRLQPADIGI